MYLARVLLIAAVWLGCVSVSVRSSAVIHPDNKLFYIYVSPFAWVVLLVSVQLIMFPRSHQWLFPRCIVRGGAVGVVCFAVLWGPLIFCLAQFIPNLPYPPFVPGSYARRVLGVGGIIVYGLTTGGFVGSMWSLAARSMRLPLMVGAFRKLQKDN